MSKFEDKILKEIEYVSKMIREELSSTVKEGAGASRIFQELEEKLPEVYLRPNNVIDAGRYSMAKIEAILDELGYSFRKEIDDKLHYFNEETSVSIYLNPINRKITLVP